MKTTPFLICAVAAAMLHAPHCAAQSNVVFYGTNASSILISFVDTNLSASAKTSIVDDLQVCLNVWGKKTYLSLSLGADEPGLVGYLERPTVSPHYPEGIEFPKGVTNTPSGIALQIPKKLSDAYTNAFAFAAANSNIVAAAYEFVAFVSSSNFVTISSNALPNYVLQKNTTTNEIIVDAPAIISELRHQTYYPPSILGFKYLEIGPSATNLWMLVPCSSPLSYSDTKEWSPYPAIWHEGKWKFCMWQN